jgi:hypothetical protein
MTFIDEKHLPTSNIPYVYFVTEQRGCAILAFYLLKDGASNTFSIGGPGGNWAECSNENTGLRAIASNIQPKFFLLKVRHHFHDLTHFSSKYHFSNKRCSTDFHPLLGIFPSGSGTSYSGSDLIEP